MHPHRHGPGAFLLFSSLFFFIFHSVSAMNRTIDDSFGDSETGIIPIYSPRMSGVWKDQTCHDCRIVPNTKLAFDNTYTSATYSPRNGPVNITIDFNGTAIYIFLIVSNQKDPSTIRNTNCVFKLDGQMAGKFDHVPDFSKPEIELDVLAFAKEDIPFGQHRLIIAIEDIDIDSYVNFDYAIYTYDNPFASNSNNTTSSDTASSTTGKSGFTETATASRFKAGAIAGGVIGGFACIAIIIIIWWFYFYRPRRNQIPKPDLLSDDDGSENTILPMHQRREDFNRRPAHLQLHTPQRETISTFAATGTPFNTAGLQSSSDHTGPTFLHAHIPSNKQIVPSRNEMPTRHHHHHHVPMHTTNPDIQQRTLSVREEGMNKQLQKMQDEIDVLTANLTTLSKAAVNSTAETSYPNSSTLYSNMNQDTDKRRAIANIPELKTQINLLHQQIKELKSRQISPQAQGFPVDDPPPGYS